MGDDAQPERGGYLQCLECGRWYRGLGSHIGKHSMTADQYRQTHGLPQSRALVGSDLAETYSLRAKRLFAGDVELRAKFAATSASLAGLASANRRRQQTSRRAGVVAALTAGRRAGGAARGKRTDERHEAAARAAGYPDLATLLREPVQTGAIVLRVSAGTVYRMRRKHHIA